MAIDPEVQAALDALTATVTANRQAATAAIQADRVRLGLGEDRLDRLEEIAQRIRSAHRDGRLDDESSLAEALAADLGMSVSDLRAALVWVTQERRKARR